MGIQTLLNDRLVTLPIMWSDNERAIALNYNHVYEAKTKHVELDIYFITEKVAAKKIIVYFIPSEDQTADDLAKARTLGQFHYLRSKLMG